MSFLAALLTVSLCQDALPPAPAPTFTFERRADGLWRHGPDGSWRMREDVVTARLAAGVESWAELIAAAGPAAARGPLGALTPVRRNALGIVDLRVPAGADALETVAAIEATGLVRYAELTGIGVYHDTPDDVQFGSQWHLVNTGQSGGSADADIDADEAWELEVGQPHAIVAVLDSGTQVTHPDLVRNVWSNPGEVPFNGQDDDANGFVDDVVGWNFQTSNWDVETNGFHGTFVAGVVAARTNNENGVAGVAGGFGETDDGCRVMPCCVGSASPIGGVVDDAVIYAADNGARVITLSLSIPFSTAVVDAIDYARNQQGVFVDCSAGNTSIFGGNDIGFPAYDANVYSVAGTTDQDQHWSGSLVGPENRLSAPAVDIRSLDLNNGFATSSGTSFASPQVAGTAALMLSVVPGLTPDEIEAILELTADDVAAPGYDEQTGWGRLNAAEALRHVIANDCDGNGLYDPSELAAGTALDLDGDGTIDACQPLSADVAAISLSGGGAQVFQLDAPQDQAGRTYVLLGSLSGTSPGLALPNVQVPLNFDVWMEQALLLANSPGFLGYVGVLDAGGDSSATFGLPPGTNPALAALTLNQAFVVIDDVNFVLGFVSNEIPTDFVP